MTNGPVGVAIVGAGVISDEYLRNLTRFPDTRVVAVTDLDAERARAVAAAHDVPVAPDVATALALDEVEIVVNLTVPAAHVAVGLAALEAGKHVYSEKPLALAPGDGERLLAQAATRGLRVGCAPDTVLGATVQSARRAVDGDLIGEPIAVAATSTSPGPEAWHPRPEFLYQPGAGPLFDLGPYYIGALITLFGSVTRVAAQARHGRAERVIATGPQAGTCFTVAVPTQVTALLDFASGAGASATFSFDSALRRAEIELTGTDGTLAIGEPHFPDGPLRLRAGDEWCDLPRTGTMAGRGVGVVDMARALRTNEPYRATGAIALHVVEVMTAIAKSAEHGTFQAIHSTCERPPPLPPDWDPYAATLMPAP